jgi:hypothetical protein
MVNDYENKNLKLVSNMQQGHIVGGNKKELELVLSTAVFNTPACRILYGRR